MREGLLDKLFGLKREKSKLDILNEDIDKPVKETRKKAIKKTRFHESEEYKYKLLSEALENKKCVLTRLEVVKRVNSLKLDQHKLDILMKAINDENSRVRNIALEKIGQFIDAEGSK